PTGPRSSTLAGSHPGASLRLCCASRARTILERAVSVLRRRHRAHLWPTQLHNFSCVPCLPASIQNQRYEDPHYRTVVSSSYPCKTISKPPSNTGLRKAQRPSETLKPSPLSCNSATRSKQARFVPPNPMQPPPPDGASTPGSSKAFCWAAASDT